MSKNKNYIYKSFPTDDLEEFVCGGDVPEYKLISDTIEYHGRWEINHKLTFEDTRDNTFWQVFYSLGATENQESEWFGSDDEVKCWKVKPVEKVITVYEPETNG
jgi:hypothetical protein